MQLHHVGRSDIGKTRAHNEDAYLADPGLGLFVVCDGVGGRASGEVASRETARLIWEWIKREHQAIVDAGELPSPENIARLCQTVRNAIQNACYMVHTLGELDPEQKGMSTTASVLLITATTGIIGQVGDTRVYLARQQRVSQLTEDHTLVNHQLKCGLINRDEARRSNAKNIITRAVGHRDYVEVDVQPVVLQDGDRFLLCSDGLHGYLGEMHEVEALLDDEIQSSAERAVRLANARGGHDNITALIVECAA